MGHHVVAYPSGTTLPATTGLPDGVALLVDGALYVVRSGSWALVSTDGGGGGGSGSIVGPWESGVAYGAGQVVTYSGDLWMATQPTTDVPGEALWPNDVTSGGPINSSDLYASVKFQVAVPCTVEAVTVQRTMGGALTGQIGITSTDPSEGGVYWLGYREVNEVGPGGTVMRTYTFNLDFLGEETEEVGVALATNTDYWLVFNGTAKGLQQGSDPISTSGAILLPESSYHYGSSDFSSVRDGSIMFDFSHFSPEALPVTVGWSKLMDGVDQASPPQKAAYPTRLRVMADTGELWGIKVSDLGVISTEAVLPPSNTTVATATDWSTVTDDQWVGETFLSQGSVETPSFGTHYAPIWFKWTATDDHEVAFDTTGTHYDTVLYVYTATGTPADYDDLTRITHRDGGGTDMVTSGYNTSRVTIAPTSGTTYYIELYSNDNGDGFGYGPTILSKVTNAYWT